MALLGIDIGGTKLALCIGDQAGTPIAHSRRPIALSGSWATDLERLVEDARRLWEQTTGASRSRPLAVGVSVPGPTDPERRVLLNPPNLPGWKQVPIARVLSEAFDVEVKLENDANAAALAEWHFGAGRGTQNLAYLTMSTGIGAGLILNGRLVRGAFGAAGEIGHAPIEHPGIACACGLFGCLEAYCGGNAWQARLREQTPESSDVLARAGQRSAIRPEHLVEAARAGDSYALEEFSRWLDYLSRGLTQLVMTLEPERIVLGTIAVAAGEELCFAPLRDRLASALWPHQGDRVAIIPAALGDELPLRAGLAVALGADG